MSIEQSVAALLGNVDNVVANDFAANKAILQNFLQHQDNAVIRILVADAPSYGHQASTVNIMRRLEVLGFNQTMYVVYLPGDEGNLTFPKLQRLLPSLTPENKNNFPLGNATCQFVSTVDFNNHVPVANIGFTGGWDTSTDNLATIYRCQYFLKLQPYQWLHSNTIARTGVEEQVNLASIEALGNLPARGFYMPNPPASIQNDFQGAAAAKWVPYNAVMTASSNNTINMMPIYGIGNDGAHIAAMYGVKPETILYNIIAGIALSQDGEPTTVSDLQKGAILPIIAKVSQDPCYNNLIKLIKGEFPDTPNLNDFSSKDLDLENRVTIINFDSEDLNAEITNTIENPKKILLVKFDGLPQPAFNYMYAQATLPSLLEGKGTANLALNCLSPFWWIKDTSRQLYPTLPLSAAAPEPNARMIGDASRRLNQTPQQNNVSINNGGIQKANSGPYTTARILVELHSTEAGDLQNYFTRIYNFFHNEEEDKLLKGTFYLLDYINAQNPE